MRALILSNQPDITHKMVKISEFPVTDGAVMGCEVPGFTFIKRPYSGPARTAIYIMQLQKSQVVLMDEIDRELLDLARRLNLPIYVHYQDTVGVRFNWEEDF